MSSSHTYVRNDDLRRIREQAARVQRAEAESRRIQEQAKEREIAINQQHQANIDLLNSTIEQIGRSNAREMDNLRAETRETLGVWSANVRQQLNAETSNIRSIVRDERERTNREISAINTRVGAVESRIQRTETAVAGIRRATELLNDRVSDISRNITRRFDEIANRESGHEEMARLCLTQLSSLITTIQDMHPEKFTPGELSRLIRIRESILNDINDGIYQAAVSLSQDAIIDATRQVVALTEYNHIYNERIAEIRQRANEIQQRIEGYGKEADNAIVVNVGGQEISWDYDIRYWSDNQFETVVSQFEAIQTRLNNADNDDNINLEELERIACSLEYTDEAITECDEYARNELISSFAIEETANRIYNTLSTEGWILGENGYRNNNEKEPYILNFRDGAGNIVSIVVGSGETPEQASYIVETYGDGFEPSDVRRRATKEGVTAALEANGITSETTEHKDDCDENPNVEAFVSNSAEICNEIMNRRRTLCAVQMPLDS